MKRWAWILLTAILIAGLMAFAGAENTGCPENDGGYHQYMNGVCERCGAEDPSPLAATLTIHNESLNLQESTELRMTLTVSGGSGEYEELTGLWTVGGLWFGEVAPNSENAAIEVSNCFGLDTLQLTAEVYDLTGRGATVTSNSIPVTGSRGYRLTLANGRAGEASVVHYEKILGDAVNPTLRLHQYREYNLLCYPGSEDNFTNNGDSQIMEGTFTGTEGDILLPESRSYTDRVYILIEILEDGESIGYQAAEFPLSGAEPMTVPEIRILEPARFENGTHSWDYTATGYAEGDI